MSRTVAAHWSPTKSVSGLDADALDELLDQLHSDAVVPMLVDLVDDSGDILTIGLGSELAVLLFNNASGLPPHLVSSGQLPAGDLATFSYHGADSEFASDQLVPVRDARAVARAFAHRGDRSGIDWGEA